MQTATPVDSVPSVGVSVVELSRTKEQPSATETPEQRDLFARAQRRKLPDERKSITPKFSVERHEGYIIVGVYADGRPGEIFIKLFGSNCDLATRQWRQADFPVPTLNQSLL